MLLRTISDVSRDMGVSTRMLRYYEQAGLIQSIRKPDYAYRVYDGEAVRRLGQILLLRKLRIPVRQIERILRSEDAATAVDVFRESLEALDAEIDALTAIRAALARLTELIGRRTDVWLNPALMADSGVATLVAGLAPPDQTVKGERIMDSINRADRKLTALSEVRIVYLPPMTVAAYHFRGEDCEQHAMETINRFVRDTGLVGIKPDLRHFGFNNPVRSATDDPSATGYEMWVSIPDDFPVPEPLRRKRFLGGLYAAHAIEFGAFDHWSLLNDWVTDSDQYAHDFSSVRIEPFDDGMDRCLEEQLNYLHNVQDPGFDIARMQLDLMMPIR